MNNRIHPQYYSVIMCPIEMERKRDIKKNVYKYKSLTFGTNTTATKLTPRI